MSKIARNLSTNNKGSWSLSSHRVTSVVCKYTSENAKDARNAEARDRLLSPGGREKNSLILQGKFSRQTHTTHMNNAWWWCVTYASPLAARSPLELGLSDGGRRVGRGRRPRGLVKMDRKKCTKKSNFLATVASEKRIFASKISRVVTQLICISRQKKARHFPCQPFVYEKIYNRNYEPGLQSERRPLSP